MPPDMGGPNSVANKLFKLQMQGGVHQLGIEEQKTRLQRINADTRRAREELLRLKAEKKAVGGTFAGRYRNKHNQRQVGCWCIWGMVTVAPIHREREGKGAPLANTPAHLRVI